MKKHMKHSDGKYHINGVVFEILIGSRAQVMHGTAYKTSGSLKKKDLKYNKHKKIVSRAKSAKGPQMLKRLHNKGYFTRKGKFGFVRKDGKGTRKARGSRKKRKVHSIKGVRWEDRAYGTGKFAKKPSYRRKGKGSKRKRGGKRSRSRRR
jgi:hypothetical protein